MSDKLNLDNISEIIHSYLLSKLDLTDKKITFNYLPNANKSSFEFKKPEFAFIKPTFNVIYSLNNDVIEVKTSSSTGKNNFLLSFSNQASADEILQSIDSNIIDKIDIPFEATNSEKKNNSLFNNNPIEINNLNNPFFGSYYGNSNINFNNETGNNPFFVDNKSGVSGNYVGPNSSIFHGGSLNNNYNSKQQPFIGNIGKNIRYDPIGPMGFGDEPIPDIEKKLFGIGSNTNMKNSNLYPEGFFKDQQFK